ncbi:MAG TPA: ATPase, partial [Clostridiales bacterium]|nr:ATPase [Clostridiales bacterium]
MPPSDPRPRPRRPPRATGALPPWAGASVEDLLTELETDPHRGLTPEEAERRLEVLGPNEIARRRRPSALRMLASQFTDLIVLVLLGAAAVSLFLGETGDAVVIIAIVVLNAVLGFVQEFRAERALERLRELAAPTARLVRGDPARPETVPAREVVPGDIVVLEEGDRVPADIRLLEAHNLQTQEAALTGESAPVAKSAAPPPGRPASVADLSNAVFMGTEVTRGRGRGLVVATGMDTEFGRIAGLIEEAGGDPTPLQKRLAQLGRYLVAGCLVVSGLVAWAGVVRGEDPYNMFLAGVSLAVAAIPEGLPAVVTVVLALGVQRMIRRNVIVRRLPAVETLGCATVVCSDKTGTLTENEMTVRRLWTPQEDYLVTGQGFSLEGSVKALRRARRPPDGAAGTGDPALRLLLTGLVLCTNASLEAAPGRPGRPARVRGDPTEAALLVAGA